MSESTSERKPCNRCERRIDAWAKICPYCNWDQSAPAPAHDAAAQPSPAAAYVPPAEKSQLKRRLLYAAGGIVMLIAAFSVGVIINRDGAPKRAPATIEEQIAEQQDTKTVRGAQTVPLIPANEPGGFEQPITSAPAGAPSNGMPDAYSRHDATAVSSVEYNQLAARAQEEKRRMQALVDPRSLTGRAYAQQQLPPRSVAQRPAAPPPQRQAAAAPPVAEPPRTSARTRPVPLAQPLPTVSAHGTASLVLLVGEDGRVKEVSVREGLPGETARLIHAVQSWRFKPATENGVPVAAPYTVDISFQ
ncbi:MAG TPA: energy transducer TonB [Thermoanaerobaculia bacterium]|nr:energy transducer TonB [Thermoanaerobaculia bacterium]